MKRFILFLFIILGAVLTGAGAYTVSSTDISFGSFSFYEPEILGEAVVPPVRKDRILFTGDIMLARSVEKIMHQYGAFHPFSQLPQLEESAYLVGNFEAAIPKEHVPTQSMEFSFSVLPEHLTGLRTYGFTHLSLANNHSYDFGEDDFSNTVALLEQASTTVFGNPKTFASTTVPLIKIGSTTVALIGVYGVNTEVDVEAIAQLVEQTEQVSEYQIIYIHWGEEYKLVHNALQEKLAHQFIDAGVDTVIGHHPHVVQDIEKYKNGIIFYSLGNFIFDQFFSEDVQRGLVIDLQFEDEKPVFTLLPVSSIDSRSAPRYMSAYEKDEFLRALSKNSDTELQESIIQGVIK